MTIKRFATVLGAAVLACATLAAPARADGSHECFSGARTPDGDHLKLSGWGCAGSGYYQVTVLIRVGDAKGVYSCMSVFSWHGDLVGDWCRQI
ncbi:hypothetical protein HII36_10225 [Nonomuraea sp. NN258]|uniref:hypothetical protein n=1 Tax=Nonomuraea antri TaxID=2730852 RepID=UPI00156A446B|nr:hypothetical protein [Nonomuraea antri]NRQ32209.1 hypothetical protein [Nonomuraea antri]